MVVRRSPGKRIRIIHNATGEVFEMKIIDVESEGHEGRPHVLAEFEYEPKQYSAQARYYNTCNEWPSAIYLHRNGEVHLRNSSGDEMTIQVSRISGKDVNVRLVDPNHLFEFQWSDHRLTA